MPDTAIERQRGGVADAFIRAARAGDFEGPLAVLDPDVVLRSDAGPRAPRLTGIVVGATAVARGAVAFKRPGVTTVPALVNGAAGAVSFGPDGTLESVVGFTVKGGRIVEIGILQDPERLSRFDLPIGRPWTDGR